MQPNGGHGFYELFEDQARRDPHGIAVVGGNGKMTYGELSARSNQLARRLRRLGLGPERLAAICADRSPLLLVGLLGILKAGAAYVPLEPTLPKDRVEIMLADAGVDLVLTQSHLASRIPDGPRILRLDDPTTLEGDSSVALDGNLHERNMAYLVYTSGSTGRPKSVAVEHRSALSLMHWAKSEFEPEFLSGVMASSSVCFDMSVFELFVPLSWGGTVILADSVLSLPDLQNAHEVTLVSTVPSAIKHLALSNCLPNTLRAVLLAGEPLSGQLVQSLFETSNIDRIWNLYGVSEDTSYSTCARIDRNRQEPVTIGRPIAERQALVLNDRLEQVPAGAVGELYLSGIGLARGYLGRPDLTAERFLPHSMPDRPGERMYRTGDLSRQRADGQLECLGRIDNQIKVRGYRIEPGEIETALDSIGGVASSTVVAPADGNGDRHLIAYVVLRDPDLSTEAIRRRLCEQLPTWMVPAVIRRLDTMPLTTNGKPNRRMLEALTIGRAHATGRGVEPFSKIARANGSRPIIESTQPHPGSGEEEPYQVTINGEGEYAIWPADRRLPPAWRHAGHTGTKAACLRYVNEMWTDMRPLSLRKRMEGGAPHRDPRTSPQYLG